MCVCVSCQARRD
ncbi:hypothetical protein DPEC_G00317560 [Dallia pectoralis]|uniref:Uncharacterized protein n=1 Tax=Dallia pectoralis TaxID=75939 RepID=A0ACC2FD91_DALPE|nr:hypothetical protein DPEC_G00317560 [Dallia pectoralis]